MSATTNDPKPWVSVTGFRTAVQAWHPVHGLSKWQPRAGFDAPTTTNEGESNG